MFGLRGRSILFLLLLIAGLFAGSQYLPAYYRAIQFNDYVQQEVKFAMAARKTPENIRAELLDKAKELNLPIVSKDILISREGPSFTVKLDYHIPIDLRVRKDDLTFHVNETGELFEK